MARRGEYRDAKPEAPRAVNPRMRNKPQEAPAKPEEVEQKAAPAVEAAVSAPVSTEE